MGYYKQFIKKPVEDDDKEEPESLPEEPYYRQFRKQRMIDERPVRELESSTGLKIATGVRDIGRKFLTSRPMKAVASGTLGSGAGVTEATAGLLKHAEDITDKIRFYKKPKDEDAKLSKSLQEAAKLWREKQDYIERSLDKGVEDKKIISPRNLEKVASGAVNLLVSAPSLKVASKIGAMKGIGLLSALASKGRDEPVKEQFKKGVETALTVGIAGGAGIGAQKLIGKIKGFKAGEPVFKPKVEIKNSAKDLKSKGYRPYGDNKKGIWIKTGESGKLLDQQLENVLVDGKVVTKFKVSKIPQKSVIDTIKQAAKDYLGKIYPGKTKLTEPVKLLSGEVADLTQPKVKIGKDLLKKPSPKPTQLKTKGTVSKQPVSNFIRQSGGFSMEQETGGGKFKGMSGELKWLKEGDSNLVKTKDSPKDLPNRSSDYMLQRLKEKRLLPEEATVSDMFETIKSEQTRKMSGTLKPAVEDDYVKLSDAEREKSIPMKKDWEHPDANKIKDVVAKELNLGDKIKTPTDTYKVIKKDEYSVTFKDGTEETLALEDKVPAIKVSKKRTPEIIVQTVVPEYDKLAKDITDKQQKQAVKDFFEFGVKEKTPQKQGLEFEEEGTNLFAKQKAMFEEKKGASLLKKKEIEKSEYETKIPVSMEDTFEKPIGTHDIIKHLEKEYDIPIRSGKFRHQAKGIYKTQPQIIRTKDLANISTASHELGHHIDKMYFQGGITTKENWYKLPLRQFKNELKLLDYDQEKQRVSEGFAEYLRHYLSTGEASKQAPKFNDWFVKEFLAENKKLFEKLQTTKKMFTSWSKQGAEKRVVGQIDIDAKMGKSSIVDKLWNVKRTLQKDFTDQLQILDWATNEMLGVEKAKELADKYPEQHPYQLATAVSKTATAKAYHFATDATYDVYGNITGKSLKEVLLPIDKKEINQLFPFLYARHALELFERNINPGISEDDAKYVFDKYNKNDRFVKAANEVTAWFDRVLQYYADAGGLSKDQLTKIREKNKYFIPLKRVFEEDLKKHGVSAFAGVVKRIKGSGRAIKNPIHSALEYAISLIGAGDKLRVATALVNLAAKTEGAGWIAERVPTPMKPVSFKTEEIKDSLMRKRGLSKDDLEMMGIDEAFEDVEKLTMFKPGDYYGKDNIISLVSKGEREFWQLHPEVYDSLKGVDPLILGPYITILGAPARAVRIGATGLRAGFALVTNPIRDMWSYLIQSRTKNPNPFKWFSGLKSVLAKDPYYKQWQRMGGELGQPLGFDKKSFQNVTEELFVRTLKDRAFNIVKHPIEALKDIFSVMEAPARIAEMKDVGKKYGKGTPSVAIKGILNASDVTVNFKRMGKYGAVLNQIIPFWNAGIQGISKMYRTGKEAPLRTALRVATSITIPLFVLWNVNKDEKWYQETPDWEKVLFAHFNVGTKEKPIIIRLPLPFEWGVMFGSLPTLAVDAVYRNEPEKINKYLKLGLEQAMPDFMPAIAKPVIEDITNYDFFRERPLVSQGKINLPPELQQSKFTTKTAGKIGSYLKKSPIKIEHYIKSYTGGLGLDAIRLLEDVSSEDRKKELADVPVIGRLFSRQKDLGQSVNDFYEKYNKAQQSYVAYNKLIKERKIDESKKYLSQVKIYHKMKHYRNTISDYIKKDDYDKATKIARKALGRN